MKTKIGKNGSVKMTAQNKLDSLNLLKFLETMAGEGDNPERASVKKEQELLDSGEYHRCPTCSTICRKAAYECEVCGWEFGFSN